MRLISYFLLAVSAITLAAEYTQQPTIFMFIICLSLVVLAAYFALTAGFQALAWLGLIALVSVAATGYTVSGSLVVAGIGVTLLLVSVGWLWSRTIRILPNDLLVITNKVVGGVRGVPGPDRILLVPVLERPLARLPRYQQEFELRLEHVNTSSRASPYGMMSHNITRLVANVGYRLRPNGYRSIFAIPNQDEIFNKAGAMLGISDRWSAMLNKQFWVQVCQLVLTDMATKLTREEVHRSNLLPIDVSGQRAEIAQAIFDQLATQAESIGLLLTEFTILQIDTDEAEASLSSRELILQAQSKAREIEMTGEAQARSRAALVRELVEAVQLSGGSVSQRTIELILQGALPGSALAAYLRSNIIPFVQQPLDSSGSPTHLPGDILDLTSPGTNGVLRGNGSSARDSYQQNAA